MEELLKAGEIKIIMLDVLDIERWFRIKLMVCDVVITLRLPSKCGIDGSLLKP